MWAAWQARGSRSTDSPVTRDRPRTASVRRQSLLDMLVGARSPTKRVEECATAAQVSARGVLQPPNGGTLSDQRTICESRRWDGTYATGAVTWRQRGSDVDAATRNGRRTGNSPPRTPRTTSLRAWASQGRAPEGSLLRQTSTPPPLSYQT